MKSLVHIQQFHKPLAAAGLVPANCRLLEITIGVDGALVARYEVFWEAAELKAFGIICQTIAESATAKV